MKIVVLVAPLLISACAPAPLVYHSAQQVNPSTEYTVEVLKDAEVADHLHRFLDSKHTVLYMQEEGGGGAAVGVLLGPIGVLANIAAIKKRTNEDATALAGKLPVDVEPMFVKSISGAAGLVQSAQSGTAPVLSPALYVEKIDDTHIRFASLLSVNSSLDNKPANRRYIYELPESYSMDEVAHGLNPAQITQLDADLKTGFDWIVATYSKDVAGAFTPRTAATIHSDFVTPRMQIAFRGYSFDAGDGRVGFAMGSARQTTVFSLPQDAAKLTM